VSTTLDLGTDPVMLDAALMALLAAHRSAEIDAAYAAYDDQAIEERIVSFFGVVIDRSGIGRRVGSRRRGSESVGST
jgi:hypothetical protein